MADLPAKGPSLTPRLALKCFCLAGNALTAMGAFTFPIISPDLSDSMKLTQSQLSTIVLAGIIGQYPFAALAGSLVDKVGTWACSACAAVLFATGYGAFTWMVSQEVTPDAPLSSLAFQFMVASYFLLGFGTVFSYFSAVFTAAKEFPHHNGLALGVALALFGLSPLFLSLPSYLFISPSGVVDAQAYFTFIGIMCTAMHAISTFGLRGPPPPIVLVESQPVPTGESAETEETPLLPKPRMDPLHQNQPWSTLLQDRYFWWIFMITACTIGSAEMVIGNIGTVVTSLVTISQGTSQAVSNQVQLLSICNTASRLISGPLIDFLCPNPLVSSRRGFTISRFVFIASAGSLLVLCYGFMGFLASSNRYTWLLSGGVGVAYGTIWTIMPGVVRLLWGEAHFGRNFGLISYAPFIGTTAWTYLFAFNVEHENQSGRERCIGPKCWRTTFQICSATLLVAVLSLVGLWRRWHAVA